VAELGVSPETITLAGNRPSWLSQNLPLPQSYSLPGDLASRVTTTLTLNDPQGIDPLTATVSDLRRADGAALIPATSIQVQPSVVSVPTNAPASIALTVDFAEAPASGEFAGSLYLYHQGGRQVVPLLVRAKTAPLLPWAFMLAGVLLGTGLSRYRAEGRSRDELVVQVGRLRNQMRADPQLDENFQASIESELVDVESALGDKAWDMATTQLVEAKTLWNRWRKGREDWIAQLAYGQQLKQDHYNTLAEATRATFYMQQVKDNLDAIYRQLRTGQYKTPQALSDAFSRIREAITHYNTGETQINQLKTARTDANFSPERETFWRNELNQLEQQLHNLTPDTASFQAWKTELDQKEREMEAEIAQLEPPDSTDRGIAARTSTVKTSTTSGILAAPATSTLTQPNQVNQAERNLKRFNQIAWVVSIIFLAWLGMIELYGNRPVFGADPLRDYFALLAWGFGAEVTRESVIRATQELGIPLTR
jgi:hypothetical protein